MSTAYKGKFRSSRDQAVYTAALDTSFLTDELGDTERGFGWHGLLLDFRCRHYIIHIDSIGFVEVDSFRTEVEARQSWDELWELYEDDAAYADEDVFA